MYLTPPVDWDISGTNIDRLMFHHVHNCTVPDFGPSTPLAKLWNNYILPLGYYSDSVKHAVIALGVAHRDFLENPSYDIQPAGGSMALEDLAMRHYRKAVSEAIQIMADPSPVNIRITLICCLVFVCYEIIRGHYDKAMQHLRSGAKVLESLHQAALVKRRNPSALSGYELCLAETVDKHFDQLCDITSMFSCIGMDATMLTESEVIPDLSFFVQPDERDKTRPFTSVSEARYQLHLVELMFSDAFDESWVASSSSKSSAGSPSDCGSTTCKSPPQLSPEKQAEWDEAQRHFRVWCDRLEEFQKDFAETLDSADKEELKALHFSRRTWELFNSYDNPDMMKDADRGELYALVDMAEELILPKEKSSRPTFALAADAVPSLSFICAFCDDEEMERRIIDLLRRMKRREGMWDSHEMANLYEFILESRLNNTWKDEYNWESLPNLARMMSNLSVSGSSAGRERSATPSPLTLL